ncbi:hypothetical protein VST7929_00088 [Vibrio stylophorae]|uniref:LysM domain-containing protein n=1 Tax=Vibrio stylophorae TaxID=659351 RepID=A0ABM8ZPT8_9VIBR|nr:LysM domain-containing protein [Vibrio stylophorae]CAH0532276.1 hypothetical protein VST7929_00088 [Vibrio stylophorae]
MRFARVILFSCLFFLPFMGSAIELKSGHPEKYTVKKGDTLWDIAGTFLNEPWLWPKLWHANPDIVNPHLIYPGDVITLIWVDGKPSLQVNQKPNASQKESAVPSVDTQAVEPYFRKERLIEQGMLDTSAKIVGTNEESIGWYDDSMVLYSDKVLHTENVAIYRIGEPVTRELEDGETVTAYRAIKVATATQTPIDNGMAQLNITQIRQEITQNDIVLPYESVNTLPVYFQLNPAPKGLKATSLGGTDARRYLATNQVTLLDVGAKDGVEAGDIMQIALPGNGLKKKDEEYSFTKKDKAPLVLPNKVIGEAMIFKTYDYFSYAIITKSTEPVTSKSLFVAPPQPKKPVADAATEQAADQTAADKKAAQAKVVDVEAGADLAAAP